MYEIGFYLAYAFLAFLLVFIGFVWGYRYATRYWRDRWEWFSAQRTLDEQLRRDGWMV